MKKFLALLALLGFMASVIFPGGISAQGNSEDVRPEQPGNSENARSDQSEQWVEDEVIVQFTEQSTETQRAEARRIVSASRKEGLSDRSQRMFAHGGLELLSIGNGFRVEAAIQALRNHPSVMFAEPNWILTTQAVSNDPIFNNGQLWGMYSSSSSPANSFGSQAARAWEGGFTGSRNVVVAVVDEGIDIGHPDLAQNIWTNPYEIPGNGIDDDGNGYIDDVNGWDFASNDNSVYDGKVGDNTTDQHGTHVAGTIGAVGGNGLGVAGVSWEVSIISAKFMGKKGGTTANAVRALDYVANLKRLHPELDIVATNNSWGGGGYSQALHDAIIRGAKQGILFVAAAGNSGQNIDRKKTYPAWFDTSVGTSTESGAGYDAVIAVAAIDSSGALASFSNYSSQHVDLGAPGVNIASTMPNGNYKYMSGTSMAAPHVTGAVALCAFARPWASAQAIKSAILSSAVPTPSLKAKTVTGGRLDAYQGIIATP